MRTIDDTSRLQAVPRMVTLQVTIQVRCSTFHRASRLCASGCTLSLHHSHESTCALCVERVANNNREGRAGKSGRCRRCPSRKPLGSAPGDGQAATAEVQTRLRDLQSTSPTLPQCAPQERALRADCRQRHCWLWRWSRRHGRWSRQGVRGHGGRALWRRQQGRRYSW